MARPETFSPDQDIEASLFNDNFDYYDSLIGLTADSSLLRANLAAHRLDMTDGTREVRLGIDSNNPYFGTYTNHYLRLITNNVERLRIGTDGTIAAMAGTGFRGWGPGGARWVDFGHNDTNAYINSSYGELVLSGTVVRTAANVGLRQYESGNTNYVEMNQQAGSYGQLITNAGDIYLGPSSNGQMVILGKVPKSTNGSVSYVNVAKQFGVGWIIGNGTASISATVSFPVPWTSAVLGVQITPMGGHASPTNETSFNAPGGVVIAPGVGSLGVNSFVVELNRASGSFSGATYYGFLWEAIGNI